MKFKVRCFHPHTLLLFLFIIGLCNGIELDGGKFANVLQGIANNALGVARMQEHYNGLVYRSSLLEGTGLVTEISSSLSAKFEGPIRALTRIKAAVENNIHLFPSSPTMPYCCQATGLTNNTKFQTKVNMNEACVTESSYSPPDRKFPTTAIRDIMINNYRENPNLKWQYLGKEDGVYLNYPSIRLDDCDNYDPRFRPFYVSTATPVQKDVVIVIDNSGSMGSLHNSGSFSKSLLQIAKEAAISVLETLNPDDRFGVVAFDDRAYIPGANTRSCHGTDLAKATPLNIKFMKTQINYLSTRGATNYQAAMEAAFRFFVNSVKTTKDRSRGKVILFLTDGDKTVGGDPLLTIRDENKKINNSVVILTYGLGQQLSTTGLQMLSNMAMQTQTDGIYGEKQIGEFKHITNPDFLRSSMASYYNRFSSSQKIENAVFSVPYQDLFGIGLITSICLPVYQSNGNLAGVACSDATMSDIMSDISYFRQGELSYAFVIDGTGRTLIHPLLPLPSSVKDDPIYVNIEHLERSSSAVEVVESMKTGATGTKTFNSKRTEPRGNVLYEGIEAKDVLSHYFWKPVSRSNFSLCIVIGDNDKQPIMDRQTVTQDSFVYHRLDLTNADGSNCRHFKRFGTKEKSVVMLTPGAFDEPFTYLDRDETIENVSKYENYLTGNGNNPGLKASVLNSVSATYPAENVWKSSNGLSEYVVWRYIGTTDGVMRFYPGVQLPKNYDHTKRGWYKRAIALKGQNVVSAPYYDLWGSGYLISLTKTITEPRQNGQVTGSGQTVAVMGVDFTMNYFYQMVLNTYPLCKDRDLYSCFVLDSSGFIVIHEDFLNPTMDSPQIENIHITYKERAIAADMMSNMAAMSKTSCIDFENIKEQFTYRVSTNSYYRTDVGYRIAPVPNSNLFVVIRKREIASSTTCCHSYGVSPDSFRCTNAHCECLCYKEANLDYCNNTYTLLSDAAQTCSPREPGLQMQNLNDDAKIIGLPFCFDPKCTSRSNKSACYSVAGCSWCMRDASNNPLEDPYCALQNVCYFGRVNCTGDNCRTGGEEEGGLSGGAIGGIVIGSLAAFGVFAFVMVRFLGHNEGKSQCNRQPDFSSAATSHPSGNAHENPAFNPSGSGAQSAVNSNSFGTTSFNSVNQSAHYIVPTAPEEHPPPYSAIDHQASAQDMGYPTKY